jgi:PAS domain S-box-containing protein
VEEKARRARPRTTEILDRISDGFATMDREWRYTFVNERAAQLTGRPRQELLGRRAWDLFPEALSNGVFEQLQQVVDRQEPTHFEVFSRSYQRWYEHHAYPSKEGVSVYWTDVTDRKRAEEALRESERKFSVIHDKAAFAIALARFPEGTIVDVNEAWVRMYGYARREAVAKTSLELGINRDPRRHAALFDELRREGSVRDRELTLFTKSGDARVISCNANVVTIGGQEYLLSTMQDVTERIEAVEALCEAQQRLGLALQAADMVAWSRDLPDGKIIWSGGSTRIFGNACDTIDDVLRRIHPDDRARVERAIAEALGGGGDYDAEYRVVDPEGRVRWVKARAAVEFGPGGEPRRIFGVSMDVTQRRTLEREILEASEREQRRIGQDLHDGLGQQLAGISLKSKALETQLAASSFPEAAMAASISALLGDAIGQARALARGLQPVELGAGGLAAALELLASRVRELFGLECVCTCDASALVYDDGAAGHLFRIAQEAASNAAKHGRATRIDIGLAGTGASVELTVRDNGTGFREPPAGHEGMGLQIMHYRERMIGASLDIWALPEGGTLLACSYRNPGP